MIVLKTRYASENVPSTDGRGEVADRDADLVGARLRLQPRDHRRREVDAVHADAAPGERQRDAAGADAELERGAVAGEPARKSTVGPTTAGSNISGSSSYRAATSSPK